MSREERHIRQELLFRALEKYSDPELALALAAKLEKFIVAGTSSVQSDDIVTATVRMEDRLTESQVDPKACKVVKTQPPNGVGETSQQGGQPKNPQIESRSAEVVESSSAKSIRHIERRRWTAAEDEELRNLLRASIGVEVIAKKLNRTLSSVYARLRQLGLARARPGRPPRCTNGARPVDKFKSNCEKVNYDMSFAAESEAQKPVGIETVIRFLRSRDYSVVQIQNGHYRLDEREELTAQALFERANRVRERLGRPRWPGPLSPTR